MIGVEFEHQGVPIATKITIFGWYDSENKRMKRKRGAGIVNLINNDTEEDETSVINRNDVIKYHPVIITKADKSDIETYYNKFSRKWTYIGYAGLLIGGLFIGLTSMKK